DMNMTNLMMLLGILLLDVLAVAYFVVPSVRTVYFDPKSRWWESAPRFNFNLETTLSGQNGLMRNVSNGGLFVESWDGFQTGQELEVHWTYAGTDYHLPAVVVFKNTKGYGLQFRHNPNSEKLIRKFIKNLEAAGVPVANRGGANDSFIDWTRNLLTKGEGLFPKRR
ncbi:MAG: PilZ domain-containing protein, partial [Oxalobacteraceae bacterium]